MKTPPLPHFISIGAARTGSTWLHQALGNHPEIFIPRGKDTLYFLTPERLSLKWYMSFFKKAKGQKICGEVCHRYFTDPHAAQAIAKILPHVKILVCLRNPVERTVSAYKYGAHMGLHKKTFAQFAEDPLVLAQSQYALHLRAYYEHFPKNQIHVSFFEDLEQNPNQFLSSILQFLGVRPLVNFEYLPKIWAARPARIPVLTSMAYKLAQWLRARGFYSLVGHLKLSKWINWILFKNRPASAGSVDARSLQTLNSYYAATLTELEQMIGKKVPASWHQMNPSLSSISVDQAQSTPCLVIRNAQLS